MLCCREIDRAVAAAEIESDEQRAFRRREGYVTGANITEPAVISLNGTVASLAVTEFLALVTGYRPAKHYTYYDMLDQRVGPRLVERDPRCFTCSTRRHRGRCQLGALQPTWLTGGRTSSIVTPRSWRPLVGSRSTDERPPR